MLSSNDGDIEVIQATEFKDSLSQVCVDSIEMTLQQTEHLKKTDSSRDLSQIDKNIYISSKLGINDTDYRLKNSC